MNGSCSKYILVAEKNVLKSIHGRIFWVMSGRNKRSFHTPENLIARDSC
jgi:hypothetical protein